MNNNDTALRPISLADYKGQEEVKKLLSLYIGAAVIRQETLDHVMIYGPSGLGKTTLANIIANEMETNIKTVAAPSIKNPQDMANILMGVTDNSVLFIDEIHRMPPKVEEILYFAMEDFKLQMKDGSDHIELDLPRFTVIGATTKAGMLSEPLRNRFSIQVELRPYSDTEIRDIVKRSATVLDTGLDDECADIIASRSRGVPRLANGYLRRVRDFATILNDDTITKEVTEEAFKGLEVDNRGLNSADRRFLTTIIERFKFGPIGIAPLCAALNDDKTTVEETIEPYLVQIGFLERTSRGRVATQLAYEFLKENR